MTSRYGRPASPTGAGRRHADPARASTGSVYNNYGMPSSYRHRDSFTSPRTSGERVVPISSETYINGQRVSASAQPRTSYDAYDSRPRRSTYDEPARANPSNVGTYIEPTVVHNTVNRGVSPATRPSNLESERHISSASTPKREHKKVYTVGDGKTTRLVPASEKDLLSIRESIDSRLPPPSADRGRRDYHLSGPAKRAPPNDDGGGYEYTDARGMYRDTEPKWRPRRGSVDSVGRERPSSMIEPYGGNRNAPREQGPPPATRGFDRINTNLGRHGSITGSITSPTRQRDRGYGSNSSAYSEDENYRVAPRIMPASRSETVYKLPSERGEIYSPAREDFGNRRESRGLSRRFEDADVTSRGFGIRAPSAEPRRSREDSIDRYNAHKADLYAKPPPRDYPRDREYARDDNQRDADRREQERAHDRAQISRTKKESPPLPEGEPAVGREFPRETAPPRDHPREREVTQRDILLSRERDSRESISERVEPPHRVWEASVDQSRESVLEDPRRDRDRDRDLELPVPKRDAGSRLDDDRPRYDQEADHDTYGERDPYDRGANREIEEQRKPRGVIDDHDEPLSHSSGSVSNGVSGLAAAGSVAYGAKQIHDKRQRDDLGTDPRAEKHKSGSKGVREPSPTTSSVSEQRREPRIPPDRSAAFDTDPRDRARVLDIPTEDIDRPRRRNYVGKDSPSDELRQPAMRNKQPEPLDPEEDYRRRVQQESERVQVSHADDDIHHESDEGRERRRRDGNPKTHAGNDEPDQRAIIERSRNDDDSASDHSRDAQALTRYKPASDGSSETRFVDEPSEIQPRKNRVSIVEPPKEKEKPKGILRKPTDKFPEDPNPIREGVAPLKDGKTKDVPSGARWTKINRSMVNPEALEEAQERFEERQEHVIVLRVLTREEIQKFADRTKEIRDSRYTRDHKDRKSRRDGRREHDGTEDEDVDK